VSIVRPAIAGLFAYGLQQGLAIFMLLFVALDLVKIRAGQLRYRSLHLVGCFVLVIFDRQVAIG
jgi:hypothetical protein